MRIKFTLSLLLSSLVAFSQVDTIRIANGSFEDRPRKGGDWPMPIKKWFDCGEVQFRGETPPDIHPTNENAWRVQKYAMDGDTYLGMVVRDNDSWEALSQRLSAPMLKGECYSFTIFLSRSNLYESHSHLTKLEANYITPAVLRIWGGSGFCGRKELLGQSDPINNDQWRQFNFKFEPGSDLSFIVIEAFYETPVLVPYNGHLLVDGASDIVRINCNEELVHEPELVQQSLDDPDPKPILAKAKPPTKVSFKSTPKPEVGIAENDLVPKPNQEREAERQSQVEPQTDTQQIIAGLDRNKIKKGQTLLIEKLYFEADTSSLSMESYPVLNEIYDFLDDNDDIVVEIQGHTNGNPGIPNWFCDNLSTARAKEVASFLAKKGIEPSRLKYKGYGKRDPIATNMTKEGRRKNQRVEIKILSLAE